MKKAGVGPGVWCHPCFRNPSGYRTFKPKWVFIGRVKSRKISLIQKIFALLSSN
jgi:hypothetical protein